MEIHQKALLGKRVILEPLSIDHFGGLCQVAFEESIWKWTSGIIPDEKDLLSYIESALEDGRKGIALPFVTIERSSGTIVGCTRFGNIDVKNRRTEIGWTWINPRWQRTAINTEAKFLMLCHAFDDWKCIRVELKTDVLNEKSRNAIIRIGAREEGIFRRHFITATGRIRDTVYFSIIDSEWPTVRANLATILS